ncbi:MAG: HNH endonuclease [Sutterellaceae bacterium]|nr:HNH endonuclease [Sutterellaceae bacterium]
MTEKISTRTTGRNWTVPELTMALGLYTVTLYSKIDKRNPQIQALAKVLDRTVGSVTFKLANFAALDKEAQALGHKGFANGGVLDKKVWNDFRSEDSDIEDLYGQIQTYAEQNGWATDFLGVDPIPSDTKVDRPFLETLPDGREVLVTVKQRVNQNYFRAAVLANFGGACVISDCSVPSLVQAAHILPWADYEAYRTRVSNGLTLNPFLHTAYDQDLLGISADGVVAISRELKAKAGTQALLDFLDAIDGKRIDLTAQRVAPDRDFLSQRFRGFLARSR